ncbi:unnamed protein product [Schistosoma curassoni]|nr:unnamed protein product [Schistosoma curassoni]
MRYCCSVHLTHCRYTFSSDQLISLYSIIVLLSTFCDCKDICKDPAVENNEEVILQSNAYKYVSRRSCSNTHIQSHFYHYSQIIRADQTLPVDDGKFGKLVPETEIRSKFPFKVYGVNVRLFIIHPYGRISIIAKDAIGTTEHLVNLTLPTESEFLEEKEYFAVRYSYHQEFDGESVIYKITTVIHSNGKIYFYYDNIPTQIDEIKVKSTFYGIAPCGEKDCPNHNSTEACKGAKTPNTTCIWCERANKCITSNDMDSHEFKVNNCLNKNSSNINATIESSLIKQEETTSRTTGADLRNELEIATQNSETYLNTTIEITEDTQKTKSSHYVYIVIPIVVTSIIVCVGCLICIWLYRRNKH